MSSMWREWGLQCPPDDFMEPKGHILILTNGNEEASAPWPILLHAIQLKLDSSDQAQHQLIQITSYEVLE